MQSLFFFVFLEYVFFFLYACFVTSGLAHAKKVLSPAEHVITYGLSRPRRCPRPRDESVEGVL